jgi:aspartate/methionine/tyrosine aminotransferase
MRSTPTSTSTRSRGGSKPLRDAIAETTPRHFPGFGPIDPETQITVTCGATEAMIAAMLGLLDPGDEVVIFEPFNAKVRCRPSARSFDVDSKPS